MAVERHFGTKVAGVAYYLFPQKTLFTTDFSAADHIQQVTVKDDAKQRVLEKEIVNSYIYRREELDKGIIEDGELTKIDDLSYTKASTPNVPLCPIKKDHDDKKLKGCPFVSTSRPPFAKAKPNWGNMKTPQETKTTHPILKGRLV